MNIIVARSLFFKLEDKTIVLSYCTANPYPLQNKNIATQILPSTPNVVKNIGYGSIQLGKHV